MVEPSDPLAEVGDVSAESLLELAAALQGASLKISELSESVTALAAVVSKHESGSPPVGAISLMSGNGLFANLHRELHTLCAAILRAVQSLGTVN